MPPTSHYIASGHLFSKNLSRYKGCMTAFENLLQIVSPGASADQRQLAIRGFADDLSWRPSYELSGFYGVEDATDHLIVEHGLENAAAFSFIRAPRRGAELTSQSVRSLLSISYNNLIEWHIFVSEFDIRIVNNRTYPEGEQIEPLTPTSVSEHLSGENFDKLKNRLTYRRAHMGCDDALISTLSRWKRILKADLGEVISNENISSLFNGIIFIRGCEDQARKRRLEPGRLLINQLAAANGTFDSKSFFQSSLDKTGVEGKISEFVNVQDLVPFEALDAATLNNLFRDFYRIESVPYEFNFELMSKHALSRIYEKYVTLLEFDERDDKQVSLFKALPVEQSSTRTGAVYTPQYVASFFSRYLELNMPPRVFRSMRAIDPACGSGIFLRNLLELQSNPLNSATTPISIANAFESTEGIDRDPNACAATRLSLALLHLVATNKLPKPLPISNDDAIKLALTGKVEPRRYDAVVANPPYIKLDHLGKEDRDNYVEFLGGKKFGRVDAYLAFVKLALDSVKVGGFVCLVLPQTFLSTNNARSLREYVTRDFEVRCLVDLSTVPVFEGVGAYTILLIVERRHPEAQVAAPAQIARVREGVGPALQACLDRTEVETPYYQVFEVEQSYFKREAWVLLSPQEVSLDKKLRRLRPLSSYMDVNQGFVSGLDKVFIRPKSDVLRAERAVWVDYLPDRSMVRYAVPKSSEWMFFFPYRGDVLLAENELQRDFPATWKYLCDHKAALESRKPVISDEVPWWRPTRPRTPGNLMRPKIVGPHLMLTPRFALDERGLFAVSHGPFVAAPVDQASDPSLLRYYCAVLNSSVAQWFMSLNSPKYGRGYNRLEVAVLKDLPVPDPATVHPGQLNALVTLVDRAIEKPGGGYDREISAIVEQMYQLDAADRALLWGEAIN